MDIFSLTLDPKASPPPTELSLVEEHRTVTVSKRRADSPEGLSHQTSREEGWEIFAGAQESLGEAQFRSLEVSRHATHHKKFKTATSISSLDVQQSADAGSISAKLNEYIRVGEDEISDQVKEEELICSESTDRCGNVSELSLKRDKFVIFKDQYVHAYHKAGVIDLW